MNDDEDKPARGRPRSLDADHVTETAMRAYWRDDPVDVSLNAICQAAGVSKPSVYRVFGGEDGLMRAALDRYAEALVARLSGMLDPEQALADTLAAFVDFASDDPQMATGCMYHKMLAARHRLGPETRARVEEIDARGRAAYAAYFTARRAAGDWPGTLDPDTAARFLADQVGLALGQRAAGVPPAQIRATMSLALSVFDARLRPPGPGD